MFSILDVSINHSESIQTNTFDDVLDNKLQNLLLISTQASDNSE